MIYLIIITLLFFVFEFILTILARFFLFKKVGIPRWKAFIPIYGKVISYKVTNMSPLWVLSEIPYYIVTIQGLRIPIWLVSLSFIISHSVDIIFAIQLGKAFHRKIFFIVLSFLFPNICQFIASVSKKYKYDEHYNRYKYRKVYGKFVKLEDVKEEKEKKLNINNKKMSKIMIDNYLVFLIL